MSSGRQPKQPIAEERREAMAQRLHYFALKGRRDPKSLTRDELHELVEIVAAYFVPPKDD